MATRSDSRARKGVKTKCAFCLRIGSGLSVYLSRGQTVPRELDQFTVLLNSVANYNLLRCPDCGTYFKKYTVTDNEIINGYVSVEIEEITEERVRELRRLEANWKRRFSRRVHSRLESLRVDFTPLEHEVIAAYIARQQEELSIYELAQSLPREDRSELQKALDALAAKRVLKTSELQGIRHYRIL
jgi:hypothetical protein